MKNIVLGILAHVDAGKTTLTEGILLNAGVITKQGRVDTKDSFLDTDFLERERGITIFSKQACFDIGSTHVDLLDTPGHVDFSAEMERTLSVLDYAVLVVSGADDIFGHTITLWHMLKRYNIPTFIFVNKMDRANSSKNDILVRLKSELSDGCVSFNEEDTLENIAMLSGDEVILDNFLSHNTLSDDTVRKLISDRVIYPVYYGSALRNTGVDTLLFGIDKFTYCAEMTKGEAFGAKVYKVTRDDKGNRITHIKLCSGSLLVKDVINDEKLNEIRVYNGENFTSVKEACSGRIYSLLGFSNTYAGQGLGVISDNPIKLSAAVLEYDILPLENISIRQIYEHIKKLEEELPELSIIWNEETEKLKIKIMGQVQLEILSSIIKDRFGYQVQFGMAKIAYRETISDTVIGVGHFEPLRHYAEVVLKITPGNRGSGIEISSDVSEDVLDKNWQRLIMTHLKEKQHKGVLTGSFLTDVKITVIGGRAHKKHTEGGDFRQATYRAVRQGLMEASSMLLEPYYDFRLSVPSDMVGRAMTDVEQMHGVMNPPDIADDKAVLTGYAPVSTMRDYQINLNAYTHGKGSLILTFRGYDTCHDEDIVIADRNYDPLADSYNTPSSVFCAHGAGYIVEWYDVKSNMHSECEELTGKNVKSDKSFYVAKDFDYSIDLEEIDSIMNNTFNKNTNIKKREFKKKKAPDFIAGTAKKTNVVRPKLLIVDGYNVIFAWQELKNLADNNIDSAKDRLINLLSYYKSINDTEIILVYDGYKVKGGKGSNVKLDDITVVHTKEDETADQYIEHFTSDNSDKYNITVVTSDGLIQLITRGHNCYIVSSKEFEGILKEAFNSFREKYNI